MWASRWSAAIRICRSLVPEDGVGGAVAGAVQRLQGAVAEARSPRRRPAAGSPPRASPSRGSCARRCAAPPSLPRGCRCAASARPRSGRRPRRPRRSWRAARPPTPSAATSAPECSTTISTRPRWSMCWWVTMTSSRSSIEWPRAPSWRLQLVQRLARVGPGVDQGQRLVLDQVAVDPPDRERGRDLQPVDPGQRRLLERLPRESGRHARISPRTSSRRRSMSSRETSDSRLRRSSGSVLEGRTLKCQSA